MCRQAQAEPRVATPSEAGFKSASSKFLWRKGGKGLHGIRFATGWGHYKEEYAVVVVSYSGREINAKLVYYGAGLCGKTTNLEAIYEAVPDTSRGKMVSMKTQSDRTLFFDLLPLDLGEIMGFKTRFLLYTVPGQVFYNATRKLVLKGADAIVFVADSEVGKMEENKESLANLRTNLAEYNINLDSIPWVLQFNKRDVPNLYSIEELNAELNPTGRIPYYESVAREGKGVFETFRGISHLLMEKVTKDLRRAPGSGPNRPASVTPEAIELPTPREQVRASAPPVAPLQAMRHEANFTPQPLAGSDESSIDYGREIELPGSLPGLVPAASSALPVPFAPAPVPLPAPVPQLAAVQASAPAAVPQSLPMAQSLPVAQSAPVYESVSAPVRPAVVPSAPALAEPVAVAPQRIEASAVATTSASAGEQTAQVVVPIKILKGGTYEIVIKLQLEVTD